MPFVIDNNDVASVISSVLAGSPIFVFWVFLLSSSHVSNWYPTAPMDPTGDADAPHWIHSPLFPCSLRKTVIPSTQRGERDSCYFPQWFSSFAPTTNHYILISFKLTHYPPWSLLWIIETELLKYILSFFSSIHSSQCSHTHRCIQIYAHM